MAWVWAGCVASWASWPRGEGGSLSFFLFVLLFSGFNLFFYLLYLFLFSFSYLIVYSF